MERTWNRRLAYPQHITFEFPPEQIVILDTLEEFLPVPETGDRYSDMARWIEQIEQSGLLTIREFLAVRERIAQEL